jgi:hypothetical protein
MKEWLRVYLKILQYKTFYRPTGGLQACRALVLNFEIEAIIYKR